MVIYEAQTAREKWFHYFRLPIASFLSIVVTLFLFYLMQSLIDSSDKAITSAPGGNIVDFLRVKEERTVHTKKRRPDPPPLPDQPPQTAPPKMSTAVDADAWSTVFTAPVANVAVSNTLGFTSDGSYLPILKVQPQYPTKALERGQFGWVEIVFTVDEIGRVIDPVVVDNCATVKGDEFNQCVDHPNKVFDRAALAAAKKFKYKPKVLDGQAIATAGVHHMITFAIEKE